MKEASLAVVDLRYLRNRTSRAARVAGDDAAIFHLVGSNHRLRQWPDYGWPGARLSPRSCNRFGSKSKARPEFAVSRLHVGSSTRITFGSLASASAMGTCMARLQIILRVRAGEILDLQHGAHRQAHHGRNAGRSLSRTTARNRARTAAVFTAL